MRHSFVCNSSAAIAETTKGKVRGYIYDGVYTFKGIPYAQAKRFHKPEPVEAWEDVKECLSYGFVCPLFDMGTPNGELMVPHRYWPMSEDCLNLNVFTPGLDDKKRPVMVWLHGGGYFAGSSIEQQVYEGGNMATYGDVVVVSINHRLNILGYFDMSAYGSEYENSGNAGTADMIAALQWIHDNIEAFGGDPANVTLFGQSGGGAKVTTLLQSPEADGLFHKGINMSGVIGLLGDAVGDSTELVEAIMKELEITNPKELETVDYAAFAKAYQKVIPELQKAGKYIGGCPQPNAHYAGDPVANGFRKETADVPLLVGSVFGEFFAFASGFLPKDSSREDVIAYLSKAIKPETAEKLMKLFEEAYPERVPADIITLDIMFRGPEIPYIATRSALNKATWSYLFNEDFEMEGGKTPWHCSDIPYVFHNCEMAPATQQDGVEALEAKIFGAAMAFAKSGDPNCGLFPVWEPSSPEAENTLVIAKDTRVGVNYDHALIQAYAAEMGPVLNMLRSQMEGKVQH